PATGAEIEPNTRALSSRGKAIIRPITKLRLLALTTHLPAHLGQILRRHRPCASARSVPPLLRLHPRFYHTPPCHPRPRRACCVCLYHDSSLFIIRSL
ncbi:hypothetical protein FS749_016469, partial [Ceratobasidium sp. UAMH 11750]